MTDLKPPRVFISYTWEDDIKAWVLDLATRLRSDGINAILDQWEILPGDRLPEFMEKSVRGSDFVIFVCTPTYKRKSDRRKGGVGYEGHIITAEVFANNNERKFIPVLRKGKWVSAAPSWATSKRFIDFSGNPYYSEASYQQLLDTLFRKLPAAPPVQDDKFPKKVGPKVAERDNGEKLVHKADKKKLNIIFGIGFFTLISVMWILAQFSRLNNFSELAFTPSLTVTSETFTPIIASKTSTASFTPTPTFAATPTFTPTLTFTSTNTFTPTPVVKLENGVPMILISTGFFNKYDKEKGYVKTFLPNFYIDKHEVTNSDYKLCVDAGVCILPFEAGKNYKNVEHYGDSNYNDYPVVLVSYYMANTYCEWRGKYKGTRLPSGDEWEKAARGLLVDRTYPWGDNPPTCNEGSQNGANYSSCSSNDAFPVERFSSNGYGIYDMSGNVAEWVEEGNRLIRGGSWLDNESHIKVYSIVEGYTFDGYVNVGFRCARDVEP